MRNWDEMTEVQAKKSTKKSFSGHFLVLGLVCLGIFASLILPDFLRNNAVNYKAGDVSNSEILAPYSLTYESKVLTDLAKEESAAGVLPAYLPPDPEIAKAQLETIDKSIYFITSVRKDALASMNQKMTDLSSLLMPPLNQELSEKILNLGDEEWTTVSKEAERVLETVLRGSIRETGITQARGNLKALISYTLPTDQDSIVIGLVSPLIVPTSIYSDELTEQAKKQAAASVQPVIKKVIAGEVLVRRGQLLKQSDLEALEKYGLTQLNNLNQLMIRYAVITLLMGMILYLYYYSNRERHFAEIKPLILTAAIFLLFLAFSRFAIINRTVIPYIFPIAAFGMTLSVLFNFPLALLLTVLLTIGITFGKDRAPELALYYILPSISGILLIGKARRISSFALAGLGIMLSGGAVLMAFRFGDLNTDVAAYTSLGAAALINGFASGALTLLFQYFFSELLDQPTSLQLMELSRPDHPLLQFILSNAPGTYQHSLLVSNLAEQAAEAVRADRLLIRVGTLYHDCGKAMNPSFFIENQGRDKIDSHDSLPPEEAAQTVIKHITDGVILARKFHLPGRIIDFIREHHGTMMTRYQYSQALEEAGNDPSKVDKSLFTYPGPTPRSKETALLMLADGTEARARANAPKTEEEIRALIQNAFEFYKKEAQLDNTDLTLHDLRLIADSFYETLVRSYHPRIKYPELKPIETALETQDRRQDTQEIKVNIP
ncbi:MAG: HDIG domain-containing protein [Anaerolineaceae bacterium]|nr:HDIG domain-containing protein [Anaerolineaceae bacterium]